MCVFNCGATLVGASGSGTSAEEVNLVNPAAGNYTVVVQGWGRGRVEPVQAAHVAARQRGRGQHDGLRAGRRRPSGATGTITLDLHRPRRRTKYLGSVAYSGIAGLPNPTIVRVDP